MGRLHLNGDRNSKGCWPSRAETELLKAGLAWDGTALQAWSRWKSLVAWEDVDFQSQRLLPLVYRNLRFHHIEDPLLPRLRGVLLKNIYQQTLNFNRVGRLLGGFDSAGIDCLLLKGAVLCLRYYGGIGTRPMEDVDLLVRKVQLPQALEILASDRWVTKYPSALGITAVVHACPFHDRSGTDVDLHWNVIEASDDPHLEDTFWQGAVPFEFAGRPRRTLSPTDLLLHVLAHGFPGNATRTLRWIPDAVLIMRAAEIDWERFCREARKRVVAARCALALAFLDEEGFQEVPEAVLRSLREHPERWFDRRYLRLSLRNPAKSGPLGMFEFLATRSLRLARGRPLLATRVLVRMLRLAALHSGKGVLRWGLSRSFSRLSNYLPHR
ncbi:MAG: nucleotidyltransferase family protein [Acidobacteriota bacterium]